MPAQCPKCGWSVERSMVECPACGVIFAKVRKAASEAPNDLAPSLAQGQAEFIDGALEEGIDLGVEGLPVKFRKRVDKKAATLLARRRLSHEGYLQNMAAFDAAMGGLESLTAAIEDPMLPVELDPDQLSRKFGFDTRRAETVVDSYESLSNNGRRNSDERLEALRRAIWKFAKEVLERQCEEIGQTLAQEAISTTQQAVFETALGQGLFAESDYVRQWVTRKYDSYEDDCDKLCPRCAAFRGKRAGIMEEFISDTGERAAQPGIHPGCGCKVKLVPRA